LSPDVLEMLKPYRHCKGPVVPQRCTPDRARSRAKQLGVVEGNFANHGRKTAISHRGTELELEGMKQGAVVTQLEHENGHSKQVSDTWYRYRRNAAQVASWRAAKRIMPETVISVYEARLYLTTQITGYVRVKMEIRQRKLEWNAESDPKVIATLMLQELDDAKKYFAEGPSLPTFVKIADPNVPILPLQRFLDVKSLWEECLSEEYLAEVKKASRARNRTIDSGNQMSFIDALS
jgi:hypothetical protein